VKYPIHLAAIAATNKRVCDTSERVLTGIGLFKLTIEKQGLTRSEVRTITDLETADDAKAWLAQQIDAPSHLFICDGQVNVLSLLGLDPGTSSVALNAEGKLAIIHAGDSQWVSQFSLAPLAALLGIHAVDLAAPGPVAGLADEQVHHAVLRINAVATGLIWLTLMSSYFEADAPSTKALIPPQLAADFKTVSHLLFNDSCYNETGDAA